MTTYAGYLVASPQRSEGQNHQSASLDMFDVDYWPPHESLMGDPVGQDAYIDNLPVTEQENLLTGAVVHSYLQDYYFRIHLRPGLLDLGDVSIDQTRTVEVWNAYFTGQLLDDIIETDATGLELTEPIAFPTTFLPLESRFYEVKFVGTQAVPEIDAAYDFDFPSEMPRLRVIGTQVQLWTFRPNWKQPIIERLEWLTDVIEHYDGSEQRIGLRSRPRRSMEFSPITAGIDRERMEAMLWAWGGNVFAVPIWQDAGRTDASALVGESILYVDTAYKDYHSSGIAVLILDSGDYEMVEVDVVLGDSITLAEPLKNNWPAGSRIYPARVARLDTPQPVAGHNARIDELSVRFHFLELFAYSVTPSVHQYRNYAVLQAEPNWREGTQTEYARKLAIIDNGTTFPIYDDESGRPARVQTFRWTYQGRVGIDGVFNWLHEREGQRVPCWINSGRQDLTLTTGILSADLSIRIGNIGYTRLLHLAIGRRDICIRLRDGTYFHRHITGSTELSAAEEQINIGSSLGQDVAIDEIAAISWLELCRMDADGVEVAWHTPEVIETVFGMRGLADDL